MLLLKVHALQFQVIFRRINQDAVYLLVRGLCSSILIWHPNSDMPAKPAPTKIICNYGQYYDELIWKEGKSLSFSTPWISIQSVEF